MLTVFLALLQEEFFLHGLHHNEHTTNFLVSTAGSFFGDWPPALPGLVTAQTVTRLRADARFKPGWGYKKQGRRGKPLRPSFL